LSRPACDYLAEEAALKPERGNNKQQE